MSQLRLSVGAQVNILENSYTRKASLPCQTNLLLKFELLVIALVDMVFNYHQNLFPMSSTFSKLFSLCSVLLLLGINKISAQQDCNAASVSMSCNNMVNVSLGTTCSQAVEAKDILTANSFTCYDKFTVNIMGIGAGGITPANVGKVYDVKVLHTISNNSCWGKVRIEDKAAPVINCSAAPINVVCSRNDLNISYTQKVVFDNLPNNNIVDVDIRTTVYNYPAVAENCGGYTLSYFDQVQNQDCTSGANNVAVLTRTWRAVDSQGNASTCVETYNIKPELLTNITKPIDVTLDCADTYAKDSDGNPSPSVTGYPKLNGANLSANNVSFCLISSGYQDTKTISLCGFSIIRKWTISNWCELSAGVYAPVTQQFEQIINVKDTKKPTFTSWNLPYVIPTDQSKCSITNFKPVPPIAKDNCDTNLDFEYLLYNNDKSTLIQRGATLPNVLPGWYVLIARATDDCGNSQDIETNIEVKDETPPIAVCHQNTKIALTTDGIAYVNALSFDDGSTDNCCIDTAEFRVKRLNEDDSQYRKKILFDCSDATVQVMLRVRDCSGNDNVCTVNAFIEDKLPPVIFVENGTIKCGGEPAARIWLDTHKPKAKTSIDYPSATNPGYYDNCGANSTYVDVVGIDQCSEGTIKRVWTVKDAAGRTGTAIQTITVQNISDYAITYPRDTIFNCMNDVDTSVAVLGRPIVKHAANSCAIVAFSYSDMVINRGGGCYRIARMWRSSNLCNPNDWQQKTQFIDIIDNVAPVIGNIEVTTTDEPKKCYAAKVELSKAGVTDNCSNNLSISYISDIPGYGAGLLPATLTNIPYGKYKITYRATDNCGNYSSKDFEITIKDKQKPNAACHDNLAITLGSTGQAMLFAKDIDAGSSDNCTEHKNLKLRVQVPAPTQGSAFDSSKVDTMFTFRCPTTGVAGDTSNFRIYPIALWVGDENGNWDYCETIIVVQDNMNMCPPVATSKTIYGSIATPDNKPMSGVLLKLGGSVGGTVITDTKGEYAFKDMPTGAYDVTPEKNDYPLNGVTTFDLVLMTKHILGVSPFNNTNQYIAADVNANGSVTTADIVELRRMVLGIQTAFAKNTSWRFTEKGKNYPLNNVSSWLSNLPNKKQLFNLDIPTADFTGIKIGDINQSAKVLGFINNKSEGRNQEILHFDVDQAEVAANEVVTLTFSAGEMKDIEGYQIALNYDKNSLELLHIHGDKDAFAVLEEGLITHSQVGSVVNPAQLFGLTFRAKQNTQIAQAINITNAVLDAEAYTNTGEAKSIALRFPTAATISKFEVYQNQPNPFSGSTVIGFQLPEAKHVKLTITDVAGRVLTTLEQDFAAGYQQFVVERGAINAFGILYYRVETPTQAITKKMLIME